MDIADFAGGGRVDLFAIAFDPVAIARCSLVAQRPHSHGAGLAVGSASDCEEHLVAGLVYQSLGGRDFSPEWLAVDGQHVITFLDIQPGPGERRRGARVPRVTADNVRDPVRLAVELPINSEETLAIVRTRPVLAVHLVRVRGAQFALELPQ